MDITKIILIAICIIGVVGFSIFSWRFENVGNSEEENSQETLKEENQKTKE